MQAGHPAGVTSGLLLNPTHISLSRQTPIPNRTSPPSILFYFLSFFLFRTSPPSITLSWATSIGPAPFPCATPLLHTTIHLPCRPIACAMPHTNVYVLSSKPPHRLPLQANRMHQAGLDPARPASAPPEHPHSVSSHVRAALEVQGRLRTQLLQCRGG